MWLFLRQKGLILHQPLYLSVYLYSNFYISYRFLFFVSSPNVFKIIEFTMYNANETLGIDNYNIDFKFELFTPLFLKKSSNGIPLIFFVLYQRFSFLLSCLSGI